MSHFDFELHDYEILDLLGEGGMAQTFLARRLGSWGEFSRLCVIKRPLVGQKDHDPREIQQLFAGEVHLAAALQHPNIALTFDAGEDSEGVPFLAMEYVDGVDLAALLRHYERQNTQLPIDVTACIIAQVAAALHYAHGVHVDGRPLKLVHRDVSPDNVIIDRFGHVRLLDFGAAYYAQRGRFTKTHEARGKSLYMSPEHLGDIEYMDGRSDLFSLGIVLYQMLTGTHPFEARSKTSLEAMLQSIRDANYKEPRLLARNLPRSLANLVQQMLAPLKDGRPATGAVVAETLADHFRPVATQVELGTMVHAVALARQAPQEEGVLSESEGSDGEAIAAVATIRPPAAGTTVASKRRPTRRRGRRWRPIAFGLAAGLALAAAIIGMTRAGTPGPSQQGVSAQKTIGARASSSPPIPGREPAASTSVDPMAMDGAGSPSAELNAVGSAASTPSSLPPLPTGLAPPAGGATTASVGTGTLVVRVGAGCIWCDGKPRGERAVTLRNLRVGPHEIGLSSDCKSAIDERHSINVMPGANKRLTFPYLPAQLPSL